MIRRKTIRIALAALGVVILLQFAAPAALQAQITNGATSAMNYGGFGGTVGSQATFSAQNVTATDGSGVGTITGNTFDLLSVKGDWDESLPRADIGVGTIYTAGFLPFTVGDVPVQISQFQFSANAKWVNGGGSATIPVTNAYLYAYIYEQTGAQPGPANGGDLLIARAAITPAVTITGNGLSIYSGAPTPGVPSTYILAADRNYYMEIFTNTAIDTTGFDPNSTPSITVTNEFGGAFGDSYVGYSAQFYWQKVPEPSSLALAVLGCVGLVAWRWRRR